MAPLASIPDFEKKALLPRKMQGECNMKGALHAYKPNVTNDQKPFFKSAFNALLVDNMHGFLTSHVCPNVCLTLIGKKYVNSIVL